MEEKELYRLKKSLADKKTKQMHAMLRAISGTSRYRILVMLNRQGRGMKVTEIARVLGATMSRVSHQMRILKENDLVSVVPHGREMIYASKMRGWTRYL